VGCERSRGSGGVAPEFSTGVNILLRELPVITHIEPRSSWLARVIEEPLDPELPIIDPHHHLWNRGGDYFVDELLADLTAGHRVVATVFAQCHFAYRDSGPMQMRPVGETEFVMRCVEMARLRTDKIDVCAGIVGYADLELGESVDEVLQAHVQIAGDRFKGVRRLTARHDEFATHLPALPIGLMEDSAFRRGFSRLRSFGLSYDAWVYHTQILEVVDLARAFPDTTIVLDHLGSPLGVVSYEGQRDEVFRVWRAHMQELSSCPNVYVKLGGLGMSVCGFSFHHHPLPPSSTELAEQWKPYIASCIELFGAERCMFESNFPVDKGVCSYPVLWNAFKRIVADASAGEKASLFHDTAKLVYRL
jgi:L-fuconolactonase